jgi:hypothetical protein
MTGSEVPTAQPKSLVAVAELMRDRRYYAVSPAVTKKIGELLEGRPVQLLICGEPTRISQTSDKGEPPSYDYPVTWIPKHNDMQRKGPLTWANAGSIQFEGADPDRTVNGSLIAFGRSESGGPEPSMRYFLVINILGQASLQTPAANSEAKCD